MSGHIILYIIDDDVDDQEHLLEVFKEIDTSIECFTAMNGQEGLSKLKTHKIPKPGIIFLDINMPRIDGKRFIFELKLDPQFENIPIIIYTTSSSQKDMRELKLLGASDYIVKDADFSALKEKLSDIIETYLPV